MSIEAIVKRQEPLVVTVQALAAAVGSLCTKVDSIDARVTRLETQNAALLEIIKKTAIEQVKVTQRWANVIARAPTPPGTSPSPPASFPSIPKRFDES